MLALPDSELRILENLDLIEGGSEASCGAMIEGRLNEAKMVMLSRTANKAKDNFGTTAAAEEDFEGAPNILTKHESLYIDRLMFTDEVARNLAGPAETLDAGFEDTVDVSVSTVLAAS